MDEDLFAELNPVGTQQSLQVRAIKIILAELKKEGPLDPLRAELINSLAGIAIVKCWERSQKHQTAVKKVRLRRKQTEVEKVSRKIAQRAGKKRKEVQGNAPWSVDKEKILNLHPNPVQKADPAEIEKANLENALSFMKKPEEQK